MIKNSTRIDIHPHFVTVNKQKIPLSTLNSVINPNPLETLIKKCPDKRILVTLRKQNQQNSRSLIQLLTDIGKREEKEIILSPQHIPLNSYLNENNKQSKYTKREQTGLYLIALLAGISVFTQHPINSEGYSIHDTHQHIIGTLTTRITDHNNEIQHLINELTPILNKTEFTSIKIDSLPGNTPSISLTIPFSKVREIEAFLNHSKTFSLTGIKRKAALNEITLQLKTIS